MQNAQILIVNHALFFSDLALRREGASILPDYDVVMFDEAHSLESVAGDHLGLSVSSGAGRIPAQQALQRPHQPRPAGAPSSWREAEQQVLDCRYRADDFFQSKSQRAARGSSQRPRPAAGNRRQRPEPGAAQAGQAGQAAWRIAASSRKSGRISSPPTTGWQALGGGQSNSGAMQQFEESVYWIDATRGKRPRTMLAVGPGRRGAVLREQLVRQGSDRRA